MNAYEILSVDENADAKTIKRAYNAKVKLCSPERDPEGFKRLREAYEILIDPERRSKEAKSGDMPDKARILYEKALKIPNEEDRVDKLAEAFKYAPENALIAAALGEAYVYADKPGKATGVLEPFFLTGKANGASERTLLLAYLGRRWYKKAHDLFYICLTEGHMDAAAADAYIKQIGSRDSIANIMNELLTRLSAVHTHADEFDEATAIIALLIKYSNNESGILADLINANPAFCDVRFFRVLTVKLNSIMSFTSPADNRPTIFDTMIGYMPELATDFEFSKYRYENEMYTLLSYLRQSDEFDLFKLYLIEYVNNVFKKEYEDRKSYTDVYVTESAFFVLDAQMAVIDGFPTECSALIKGISSVTPLIWSHIEQFITRLQSAGNKGKFKERFLISAVRTESPAVCERIEEMVGEDTMKYLETMARSGETVHSEKKPGRNDPCPCGSGKKYKKCCGK